MLISRFVFLRGHTPQGYSSECFVRGSGSECRQAANAVASGLFHHQPCATAAVQSLEGQPVLTVIDTQCGSGALGNAWV